MGIAMLVWGISWPNAKITGQYAGPELLIFWRFILASFALMMIMLVLKKKLVFPKSVIRYIILSAFCLSAYNYGYFKGTQIGMASLGGIIVPTFSPLVTYFLAVFTFGKRIQRNDLYGFIIGVLGGLVLLRIWEVNFQNLFDSGNIYFIFSAVIWAFVTIMTQKSKKDTDPLNFSFWLYIFSAFATFFFVPNDKLLSIFSFDWIFWVNFFMVSVVSLAIGTVIFFEFTMKIGSEKASAFMYIVPLTAMTFSVIFLNEPLFISTILGGSMALIAVYMVNRREESR